LTSGLAPVSLIVVGVDVEGAEVARLALGHGDDPTMLLAVHGWQVRRVRDVVRHPVERHVLTLVFVVEPTFASPQTVALLTSQIQSRLNDELVTVEGEVARRHQRVAAYALVTSFRGFLMTQFSGRTGAEGQWGLPGGGLDDEEAPARAVVREVWEESGQLVEVGELALIQTSRWVGRAPTGRLEDFHAVRVVYRAVCPEPTEPVVHDVGGTTASAAWLQSADLDLLALTSSWRSILRDAFRLGGSGADVSEAVTAPDETDGPDHHHHDTDSDDRARSQP
jgi:8-oxo-dGTP diphosphatase